MKTRIQFLFKCLCVIHCLLSFNTSTNAQEVNGIYSDGQVSLHLEETAEGFNGLFIDIDGSYYEAYFLKDEEGLIGMLDAFAAFIPWNTEVMTLVIMPLDEYEEPIMDEAITYELEYVAGLYEENQVADYGQLEWTPHIRFGEDLYPSFVLATATWSEDINYSDPNLNYQYLGDGNGYFGVSINNFPIGSIVRVEVEGQPLVKKSSYATTITNEGLNEIFPLIEYDYEKLRLLSQPSPLNLKYRLYLNDELIGEHMDVVWVRSINDALIYAQDYHGNEQLYEFIFAAFVNEDEPMLDPVMAKCLDYGIINSWTGPHESKEMTLMQVFALWYHFQKEGFRYSNIGSYQSSIDNKSYGQNIRFPSDALNSTQANCIDGTVLFASFLYKLGIDVSIVLVPGHAYLAFALDNESQTWVALETTLIGELDIEHKEGDLNFYSAMDKQEEGVQQSWALFLDAMEQGTNKYLKEDLPNIKNGVNEYGEINILNARKQNIRPIK